MVPLWILAVAQSPSPPPPTGCVDSAFLTVSGDGYTCPARTVQAFHTDDVTQVVPGVREVMVDAFGDVKEGAGPRFARNPTCSPTCSPT